MPLTGDINIAPNDLQRETCAASKSHLILNAKFSQTSYTLGSLGDGLAKQLHETRYLYATYGALDGLSNTCSHWRFLFDIIYFSSDANSDDKLHEFLSSTEGMAFVGIETLAVMVYAAIGNYFDKDNKNQRFLNFLASTWPYFRDCFKASKNTFKGIRATLNIASFLLGTSLLPYVVPTTLGFGILAIINRLLMRYMYTQRKNMMKNNKKVWLDIQKLNATKIEFDDLVKLEKIMLNTLQQQPKHTRLLVYWGAAFGGFIDGLYMYVGIITLLGVAGLVWLTAPVALFLISCSVLYGLINIAVRVYEEYNHQKKLDASLVKAELALTGKKIESLYFFLRLEQEKDLSKQDVVKLYDCVETFVKQRERLKNLNTLSYRSAFLLGITHGLAGYGALTSLLLAVSTIAFLVIQTIPPVLVITTAITIASGLLFLIAFAANAIYKTYQHRQKAAELEKAQTCISSLEDFKGWIKLKKGEGHSGCTSYKDLEKEINDCMVTDDQPLFFYTELFEIVRSFFSGIGKGSKSVTTTFNALQEKGEDGHYHFESSILFAFISVSSLAYSVCLALRAYARGFGKPAIDKIENKPIKKSKSRTPGFFAANKQNDSTTSTSLPIYRLADTDEQVAAKKTSKAEQI